MDNYQKNLLNELQSLLEEVKQAKIKELLDHISEKAHELHASFEHNGIFLELSDDVMNDVNQKPGFGSKKFYCYLARVEDLLKTIERKVE